MSEDTAEYVSVLSVVHRLATCDPRPTTDDDWCYFCGRTLAPLTSEPLETGHDQDNCLWVAARRVAAHSGRRSEDG